MVLTPEIFTAQCAYMNTSRAFCAISQLACRLQDYMTQNNRAVIFLRSVPLNLKTLSVLSYHGDHLYTIYNALHGVLRCVVWIDLLFIITNCHLLYKYCKAIACCLRSPVAPPLDPVTRCPFARGRHYRRLCSTCWLQRPLSAEVCVAHGRHWIMYPIHDLKRGYNTTNSNCWTLKFKLTIQWLGLLQIICVLLRTIIIKHS